MHSCISEVVTLEFRVRLGVLSRLVRVDGRCTGVVVVVLVTADLVASGSGGAMWLSSCWGIMSGTQRSVGLWAHRASSSIARRCVAGGFLLCGRGATSPPEAAALSFPFLGWGTFRVWS